MNLLATNNQLHEIILAYEFGWEESNVVGNVEKYYTLNFVRFPVYAKKKKDQKPGKVLSWRINKDDLIYLRNSETVLGEDLRNGKIKYC